MAKEKENIENNETEAPEKEVEVNEAEEAPKEEKQEKASKAEKKKCKKEKDDKSQKLQKELDEKNEQYLRLAAEYDNFRKRSQREKEALYGECKSTVVKELLNVIDNFERCVAVTENTSFEDYRKGVEMTYKQWNDALKKLGVEAFGEVGETFDPNLHNAIMHSEDENLPENSIQNVLMKGYKLGDKVIRPAMVAVAN
ncbi:MAG: nucleotide exchange factor GrpE [Clostridia bacterium]|nr:nucleotide exchange factor GrpE [Clostridia bacterium]